MGRRGDGRWKDSNGGRTVSGGEDLLEFRDVRWAADRKCSRALDEGGQVGWTRRIIG